MPFEIVPMLPGDLFDAAGRYAADTRDALAAAPDAVVARAGAWQQAVAMGWPAVLVADRHGGVGGTLADVASVVEAAAGAALALPLVERCGVVPALLQAAATPEADALLARIAATEADVALLTDDARIDLSVGASHYLVALPRRRMLVLVAADALPLGRRWRSVDGRTIADVDVDRLPADAGRTVARGDDADRALAVAADVGALLVCAESVGAQATLVQLTIDHLETRQQFGQALATFQVLRHRVVDMYVGYECTRGLVGRTVADAVERGAVDPESVSLAKCYVARTGRSCAEAAIQLHGGMGMTEELLVARVAERLLSAEFDHGDRYVHLRRLARNVPAAAAEALAA